MQKLMFNYCVLSVSPAPASPTIAIFNRDNTDLELCKNFILDGLSGIVLCECKCI